MFSKHIASDQRRISVGGERLAMRGFSVGLPTLYPHYNLKKILHNCLIFMKMSTAYRNEKLINYSLIFLSPFLQF